MYKLNELVSHRTQGVCRVKEIGKLPVGNNNPKTEYYYLSPLHERGSMIYMPVDRADASLRPVMNDEELKTLLSKLSGITCIQVENEKTREEKYRTILKSGDYYEVARLIKTLHTRKEKRLEAKKKPDSLDERYLKLSEKAICGEMSVPLNMSLEETSEYIGCYFEKKAEE